MGSGCRLLPSLYALKRQFSGYPLYLSSPSPVFLLDRGMCSCYTDFCPSKVFFCFSILGRFARVVELVDSLDSGSSAQYGRGGSSPPPRTTKTTSSRHMLLHFVSLAFLICETNFCSAGFYSSIFSASVTIYSSIFSALMQRYSSTFSATRLTRADFDGII